MEVFSTFTPWLTRVAWGLTSESLYESFLNSRVNEKREQKLHESWCKLTSESVYEISSNLLSLLVKREHSKASVSRLLMSTLIKNLQTKT